MKTLLPFIILLSISGFGFGQAPTNDECANRININVNTAATETVSVDLSLATPSSPQLLTDCETNAANVYHDVWYEFTMPVDGSVRITSADSTEGLTIYDACGGVELGCEFNNGYFYNLTATTTYVLRYSERDIYVNVSDFDIRAFATIANDECAARETITVTTGSTTNVSTDFREANASSPQLLTNCETNASNVFHDVWYEFIMPVNGSVRITSADSTEGLTLYDACGGVELGCEFNNGYFYNLTATTTYVLRYSERDIYTNASDFNIQAFATIVNDECISRETITVIAGSTTNVSADLREANASAPQLLTVCETNTSYTYHDIWYEFTMPVDGSVRITSADSTEGITLYDSCGGLELGCEFNNGYFYNLTATTTYVLRYSERDIYTNVSDFNIQAFATIANDECAARETITVTTGSTTNVSADLRDATASAPQLLTVCETNTSYTYHDVWYEFIMPVDGNIRITSADSTEGITLYDSCGGTELGCEFNNGYFYNLTASTTYVLRYSERDIYTNVSDFNIQAFATIANDECVNRETITVTTGSTTNVSADLREANASSPQLLTDCETNTSHIYHDIWYEFTMPVDGNIRITSADSTEGITLYDACGGTEVGCEFNNGFFYNLSATTTYVLRYSERGIYTNVSDFNIQAFEEAENNECVNATTIDVGVVAPITYVVDHREASESIDASCETVAQVNHDLWFEFTMPFNGNVQMTSMSSTERASIFDGCGGTELDCFNNDGSFFGLTSGTNYILRISERDIYANSMDFDILAIESTLVACVATTEFVGGAWNNGAPDITTNAVIRSNYNTSTDGSFTACSIAIDINRTLTVASGDYVEVGFGMDVTGTLNVEHEGNIVQRDAGSVTTNNGNINVEITTPFLKPRDFMVMGSPMDNETRADVFGNAFRVLNHTTVNFVPDPTVAAAFPGAENFADDNGDNWSNYSGAINQAEGFLVWPQSSIADGNATYDLTFSQGTLTNGDVPFSVVFNTTKNDSPNILANPYASAVSAADFINFNTIVDEVYFWEHLSTPDPSFPGYNSANYSMEDISMYNLMGGVAAASDPSGLDTKPTGIISTGQGFGIKATAAGTAMFTNSMRRLTNNTTLRTNEPAVDRIWLTVKNDTYRMQNTTLIGFSENATAAIDRSYDSRRLATTVSLYSHLEDGTGEFGIQAREAFDPSMIIPLGFSTLIDVDAGLPYSISIANLEGTKIKTAIVYLVDHQLNTVTNLNEGDYEFLSSSRTFNQRFTLQFEEEVVLNVSEDLLATIAIFPNPSSGLVTILAPNIRIDKVEVRDILGRLILSETFSEENNRLLDLSEESEGTYFVSIYTSEGTSVKKLLKK